jgi:hypothetical protein
MERARSSCAPRRASRACGDQGKRAEARELLAPIYGWSPKASTRAT